MIRKQLGFTLLEMVIVIVILAILSAASARVISQGFSSFAYAQNMVQLDWQAQLALKRLSYDLRSIPSTSSISVATNSQITFTNINGATISYQLNGSNLFRNTQKLTDRVSSFGLTYYDENGNVTTTINSFHYVGISLSVSQKNETNTFSTLVFLTHLA